MSNKSTNEKIDTTLEIKNPDDVLHLMDIYLAEWCHRDSLLWKHIYTFFFAGLVVTIVPFTKVWDNCFLEYFPKWIFSVIGIFMAFFFAFISSAYALRLKAVGKIYNQLIEYLPDEYRRQRLDELNTSQIFSVLNEPMSVIVSWCMFAALLIAGIITLMVP